ncbi:MULTISPECIES: alcohol dehydrogenase catalytic domain-containing protein [unclassified Arthrobacter]|uniref:alcohol dehydrogenase catalytic domain-containing protein n=1 Tax=unclassified Arthrobacter TaxID=235627 RepID=UPI001C865823|nr:alcohol dehydrogenase catalytic domain-containing protein [Arthrobacter sp. MAHUQ-56]MBX7445955.1 alcohol dehydrogenase catalytic domain-containing protein [Arthrobacter sp. MAHUQ-56]
MLAAMLKSLGPIETNALDIADVETPSPGPGQLLIRVTACGVCRSNLHMIEGDWAPSTPAQLPIIPGHEVVGAIEEVGAGITDFKAGDRVGVQPIFSTCRGCEFCISGREQLCRSKKITGENVNGGYAEYMIAEADFAYRLPEGVSDLDAAPLLCPGITAYGSVSKARLSPGKKVAVYGVGGVGHLVIQMAALHGADVYAVTRGKEHQDLADELGATVIDSSREHGAGSLIRRHGGMDSTIVFAPSSVVLSHAIQATKPGGIIVVGADGEVGPLPFAQEKTVVGSILGTRQQMREVLTLAAEGKIRAHCEAFPLNDANEALKRLKNGHIRGRAVLMPNS